MNQALYAHMNKKKKKRDSPYCVLNLKTKTPALLHFKYCLFTEKYIAKSLHQTNYYLFQVYMTNTSIKDSKLGA
jgi:hypothetical protein